MSSARVVRAVTAVTLAVPMSGVLLLAGAGAASAAVLNPGDGASYTSETAIAIRADHGPSGSENRLTLTSPSGEAVVVATSPGSRLSGGTLSYTLDLGCWTFPSSSCSGRQPAPNGTWVLTQSGGATDRTTFTTRIAPAAPTSVSADGRSLREVAVSWNRGSEPDLLGFAVFEGDRAVKESIPTSACEASRCSTVVSYGADSPGEHTYVVRAYRPAGPGSGDVLASPPSAAGSATVAAPGPSPTPTQAGPGEPEPAPTEGGTPGSTAGPSAPTGSSTAPGSTSAPGSTAGPGGSGSTPGSGGSPGSSSAGRPSTVAAPGTTAAANAAVAQRRAFASGFSAFGPKLGIPKLPPLPQSSAQQPAIAAPLPDGTFAPTLGFEDQVVEERVETLSPGRRVTSAVGNALDGERLARSTAGALVLLLAGAHLRRWIGAPPPE